MIPKLLKPSPWLERGETPFLESRLLSMCVSVALDPDKHAAPWIDVPTSHQAVILDSPAECQIARSAFVVRAAAIKPCYC